MRLGCAEMLQISNHHLSKLPFWVGVNACLLQADGRNQVNSDELSAMGSNSNKILIWDQLTRWINQAGRGSCLAQRLGLPLARYE